MKNEERVSDLTEKEKKQYEEFAHYSLNKQKRITIRISERDLMKTRAKAIAEGIPYQALVSMLIHNYSEGKVSINILGTTTIGGRELRNKYLMLLDGCFQQLASHPLNGQDCSKILPGYRKMNAGGHVVFYRKKRSGKVEIVRILHGCMDI